MITRLLNYLRRGVPSKGLFIHVGENTMQKEGWRIYLDGVDITDRLAVKSMQLDVSAENRPTVVSLECYVVGVEVLAGRTDVTVYDRRTPQ